jgi:rubrerythrin
LFDLKLKGELLMPNLEGTKTEENLIKSFTVESQARNRYDYYATQASEEGYDLIAEIFAETAINEKQHAKRFFRFLRGTDREIIANYSLGVIGDTKENLNSAIAGEKQEHSDLYPKFARVAEEEGFPEVADVFSKIADIEEGHEARYLSLLDRLTEADEATEETKIDWKCIKCGYVYQGTTAPEECPVCEHSYRFFRPKNNFRGNYYRSDSVDHNENYYKNHPDKGCYAGACKSPKTGNEKGYHNTLNSGDHHTSKKID